MFKTYFTKSSAGHYTVTIKNAEKCTVFTRRYVDNLVEARQIASETLVELQDRAREPWYNSQYGKLSEASYAIADYRERSAVQDVLCSAADNATDTMQEVEDRTWESVFRGTLESILCDCSDAVVRDWFRAQGVAW